VGHESSVSGGIHATRDHNVSCVLRNTKKNCAGLTIQNKRCGMLTYSVNAPQWQRISTYSCPHWSTAVAFKLVVVWPLSLQPWSCDCHLFAYLKNWLQSQCFNSNDELREGVETWPSSQVADFFHKGIQKLIFPDTTSASIPAVTMLRSSLNMYTYFVYNTFFLIACLINSISEVTFRIVFVFLVLSMQFEVLVFILYYT
jgi:hypothetical protein